MDYFSLCLEGLCLAGQAFMHIIFVSRLTGKMGKIQHIATYFFLLFSIDFFSAKFSLSGLLPVTMEILALYGVSRFIFGNRRAISSVAAIFAVYISQLSFGIVGSAEVMLFPAAVGKPLLYPLVILATLTSFVICGCCYAAVLKFMSPAEGALAGDSSAEDAPAGDSPAKNEQMAYIEILLLPGLFFFSAQLYILHTSYSVLSASSMPEPMGKHGGLLFLQTLGLAALLCTLHAYRRLCQGFQAQAALQSLTQAAQAQKVYVAEARTRYEQTKAFRHDIKNHLSVLSGLLGSGRLDEGREYLKKLDAAQALLSFPRQTGNPVVDILLGEKLGLAEADGITADISLILPRPCGVDDFDLCVIFANALDNAIDACRSAVGTRSICIHGERQGDFFMLTFENTCSDAPLPPAGTGLSNIKAIAEKYHGAMAAEKTGCRFSLHVLLDISLHSEGISAQKP